MSPDRRAAPGRSRDRVVAGRRTVLEAIRAGRTTEVLIARGARATPALREVTRAADEAGVPMREVTRSELDALASDHHGVAARMGAVEPLDERELATRPFDPDALVVVLDGIEDPQNLGAAARSAEAAGAAMLVTRTRRSADVSPAAIRASAGALLHLPHARVANIARALGRLRDGGFTIVGLHEGSPVTVYEVQRPPGRVAVVVGSEGEGMARLTREACDLLVALPVRGRVASLNASAALAAVLYALVLRPDRSDGA